MTIFYTQDLKQAQDITYTDTKPEDCGAKSATFQFYHIYHI